MMGVLRHRGGRDHQRDVAPPPFFERDRESRGPRGDCAMHSIVATSDRRHGGSRCRRDPHPAQRRPGGVGCNSYRRRVDHPDTTAAPASEGARQSPVATSRSDAGRWNWVVASHGEHDTHHVRPWFQDPSAHRWVGCGPESHRAPQTPMVRIPSGRFGRGQAGERPAPTRSAVCPDIRRLDPEAPARGRLATSRPLRRPLDGVSSGSGRVDGAHRRRR